MPKFMIEMILKYIIQNLSQPKVAELVNKYVLPILHGWKATIVAQLRAKAKDTSTPINDAAVDVVEAALEAILKPMKMLG